MADTPGDKLTKEIKRLLEGASEKELELIMEFVKNLLR